LNFGALSAALRDIGIRKKPQPYREATHIDNVELKLWQDAQSACEKRLTKRIISNENAIREVNQKIEDVQVLNETGLAKTVNMSVRMEARVEALTLRLDESSKSIIFMNVMQKLHYLTFHPGIEMIKEELKTLYKEFDSFVTVSLLIVTLNRSDPGPRSLQHLLPGTLYLSSKR
jgi:hypothetical protein